jgi:hypothetical protein
MSGWGKMAVSSAILAASLVWFSPFSFAKPDYMKKEQKPCTYCHIAPNKKSLNDVGKCYAEHGHSLDKCNPKKIAAAER